jgi:hypothetical protein
MKNYGEVFFKSADEYNALQLSHNMEAATPNTIFIIASITLTKIVSFMLQFGY